MWFTSDPNTLSYHLGETEMLPGMARQMLFGNNLHMVAVDTETISLKEKIAIGIGVAVSAVDAFYFRLFPDESPATPWHLFRDPSITKVYHNCVPTTTRALTKDGWKLHSELSVGDMVLGYDTIDGSMQWCAIKQVFKPENMELIKFGNKHITLTATANHRWFGGKSDSISRSYDQRFISTSDLLSHGRFRITLSAPYKYGGSSDITPDEARIIAWILTDGSLVWKKGCLNTYISQSKEAEYQSILDLCGDMMTSVYEQCPANEDNPNIVHRVNLSAPKVRQLWDKAGLPHVSKSQLDGQTLDRFILSLSKQAREAFLDTLFLGDGFWNGNNKCISQKNCDRVESFMLAAFLCGFMPHRRPIGFSMCKPYMTGQHAKMIERFVAQAWCIETELGSWVARDDVGNIFLTGNCLFDAMVLREFEVDNVNIMDTSVMSRLLCYKFNSLVDLSSVHQVEVHDVKEYIPSGGTMLDVNPDVVARKCMQDCLATYRLYQNFIDRVDKQYLSVEMQVIPICIEMSNRGLMIDQQMRQQVEEELQKQADFYESLCTGEGFNPGSPQQVSYILAKRGAYKVFHKLPFTNYHKKSLSSAVEVLKAMDDPLASIILEYRMYSKLLSTYIKPWAREERATTRFHLDAITGRPSSTERNMQNIPGKVRKDGTEYPVNCRGILVPDNGTWTDADWEQLEPRCLAYLSGDKEMQHIFSLPKYLPDGSRNEEADIHLQVGNFMGIPRRLGKTINLAMTYGATIDTLMEQSGIKSRERVVQLKAMWGKKFPEALDWIESRQEDAIRTGVAKTVFGRSIRLPDLEDDSLDGIRRKAVDYPCQGSAAEILKRGLIALKQLPIALQVHDEFLVDGYYPEHTFEPMTHIAPFTTPVSVKYLNRWE